jgi:hypothetical protein
MVRGSRHKAAQIEEAARKMSFTMSLSCSRPRQRQRQTTQDHAARPADEKKLLADV